MLNMTYFVGEFGLSHFVGVFNFSALTLSFFTCFTLVDQGLLQGIPRLNKESENGGRIAVREVKKQARAGEWCPEPESNRHSREAGRF